ncbi:MAG: DUF222 domain-containing protein [Ornithinimicrobium sp.]
MFDTALSGRTVAPRGVTVRAAIDDAGRALGDARGAAVEAGMIPQGDLVASLEGLVGLRAVIEPILLTLISEAVDRGLPGEVGLTARDWLGARCPWLTRSEIGDVVTVAEGITDPRHTHLAEVAYAGGVPLRRIAKLMRSLERISAVCDADAYAGSIDALLPVVTDVAFTDKDLHAATDHLLECALPDKDKAAVTAAAYASRGLHESSLAGGLLTRFVVTCDRPGAALIRAILTSPLAAPAPGTACTSAETSGDDNARDERTAQQRRYDALITVLERGLSGPAGTPTTSRAKIFLTMSYDTLANQLMGAGRTFTKENLTASSVRTLACSADLIPIVLGTDSEVLDVGREHRLATPGQIKALWHRDKGCTFPGCSTPATWTDAHHVNWWSRSGRTDLTNLALLCGRHHTRVHEHDLSATISTTNVTWHL